MLTFIKIVSSHKRIKIWESDQRVRVNCEIMLHSKSQKFSNISWFISSSICNCHHHECVRSCTICLKMLSNVFNKSRNHSLWSESISSAVLFHVCIICIESSVIWFITESHTMYSKRQQNCCKMLTSLWNF